MVVAQEERNSEKASQKSKQSKRENGISAHLTLVNFLKAMIGPGCFSLPLAFKEAGLWAGFALVFIIGFVCCVSMMKIVKCSQYLAKKNPDLATLDYGQMAEESFKNGGKKFKPLSVFANNIKCLSYVSLAGNFFMLSSILLIFWQLVRAQHEWRSLPWFTSFNGIVLAAGAIIYALEGQALVLPLENRMKHGCEMRGWTGVLSTGLSLISIIYAANGFFGYITYGSGVKGSITLNLPNDWINLSAKILTILAVLTGYPMVLFPAVDCLWNILSRRLEKRSNFMKKLSHYVLRSILFLITVAFAVALPSLEDIISLIGVTSGMMLALVIPAILDLNTFLPKFIEKKAYFKALLLGAEDLFFACLGLFFLVAGLITNIEHLAKK